MPLFNERNDVSNVKTVVANLTTGQFSVSFSRPFLSNETDKDSNLTLGLTPVIWSYGDIVNGKPLHHDISGVATFNMQTGEKVGTSFAFKALKVSAMGLLSVLAFFFF